MLRVTLEPGIAEEIFDSIQALVSGTEVDVTKLALRGSSEFIPTKNPVIKQAMAQATGELTGEKAALVEQLGKYQDLSKAIRTSPKKPFAAQVEKYSGFLEGKTGSTKRQLNSLLDRVDTMVQRGMLTESQANKITRRTPGEPKRSATESGQQRYMPASDMASGRSVKDHREAMDLFEKGYRLYGALYDGMEDPVRLKKASEIERFDPENLWAVPSKKIAAAISVRNMPASDTDYLSTVKQGDTATAQRMVDEAAEANGYTVGPVYHRTSAKNITEFRPWVNFGTEEQATNVDLTGRGEGDTRTYRAFLNVSNPIRVQDEGMAASNVLQQAREQGVVSGGEMAGFPYNKGDDVERAYVAKVLEKNGFDGIVYENEYEV
jgi:hypothetical protein